MSTTTPVASRPALLTAKQFAEYFGITEQRAYHVMRVGLVPTVRLGRSVRVHAARLEEWLANGGCGLEA